MLSQDIFLYVIIGIVLVVCLKMYSESEHYNLKCIISDVDGERYCVRERSKLKLAADLLAQTTDKCKKLVLYVGDKYPDDENVLRLVEKFNPKVISETLPTSEYTAYSENKGEKVAFCLNKKKDGSDDTLIDLNTLTFVAIHELSHVMTEQEGHTLVFWQNFKFLLENAVDAGLYDPVDYKKKPKEYCSMMITDSPLYNLN
jgi:hypothetical protein